MLRSFEKDLNTLFGLCNQKERCAFYAGFFDAEGHVDKYHQRFEFHQYVRNTHIITPLIDFLRKDGFDVRYHRDRCIFLPAKPEQRKANFGRFGELIVPFIKEPCKKEDAEDLIAGNRVKRQYVLLAKWLLLHSNSPAKEVAKAFAQSEEHTSSKLQCMAEQGLLIRERAYKQGKPFLYMVTNKGETWISKNRKLAAYILDQVNKFESWSCHMYEKDCAAITELL